MTPFALFLLGLLCPVLLPPSAPPPAPPAPGEWREPRTGIAFVRIPAGTFRMGTPAAEVGHEAGETLHTVRLTRPFLLGKYEVTQGQWERVTGRNPSAAKACGPDCPVETVTYHDVEAFLAALDELTGRRFRLPTEAEWEYACRAGTTTPFATGANLTADEANVDGRYPYAGAPPGRYRDGPTRVGSFAPNPWGLFDMHGNVWEWCADWSCPYATGPATDPVGACETPYRVIRGGSWLFNVDSARCGVRYTHRPQDKGKSLGLRLALDVE